MPRFAANLSMMFTEVPFPERFAAAARAGFTGVEFLFPYDFEGIGHVQIAGVPERHEPDEGEVDYGYVFRLLDEMRCAGWVGCEYRPRGRTADGLGWLRPWLTEPADTRT